MDNCQTCLSDCVIRMTQGFKSTIRVAKASPLQRTQSSWTLMIKVWSWSETRLQNGRLVRKGNETRKTASKPACSQNYSFPDFVPPSAFPFRAFQKPHVVSNLWISIMWFTFLWFNIVIKSLCSLFQVTEMKQYVFFKILCPLLVIFPFQICTALANKRKINFALIP